MQAMTSSEARKWCAEEMGLAITRYDEPYYKSSGKPRFFVAAPEEDRKILFLTRTLLTFRGENNFSGGLVWLQRWDIGRPEMVRVGWRILEDIRRAHGEHRSLEVAPAQRFRGDEFYELQAFLAQVVAFGWVADYVAFAGGFVAHFKDNGQVCLSAESPETLAELRAFMQDWNPSDEDPMVVKLKVASEGRRAGRVAHTVRRR